MSDVKPEQTKTVREKSEDYFRSPSLPLLIIIPPLTIAFLVAGFKPRSLPYDYIGNYGPVLEYLTTSNQPLIRKLCYILIISHFFEAMAAAKLSRSNKMRRRTAVLWAAQTFLYGYFSLRYILKYNKNMARSKHQ